MRIAPRQVARLAAPLVALGLTATACGGTEKEYAVPETLCGVPVTQEALDPLLPDGSELMEQPQGTSASKNSCKLFVDKQFALFVTVWQVTDYPDPLDSKEHVALDNPSVIEGLPPGQKGAIGDESAMITARCTAPDKNVVLEVTVNGSFTKDVAQRRDDVERFAKAFTGDVRANLNCTE
ncbi:hypothetical protein [Streptomyces sp. NPDC085466]|uniref:hypothetical protein n=1 Tax=Streptomyces sp. NPDC085466 TaxID=3365725 RepID=UPI0037D0D6A6